MSQPLRGPSSSLTSVTVRAGAKVNPLLAIHGRREDGYHELTTLMLGLDLFDEVTVALADPEAVRPAGAITVTTTGPHATDDIPTDATNLAARGAALALEALGLGAASESGPALGLAITVHKRIPSRAGLGGGSSDAAAAALATLELFGGRDQGESSDSAYRATLAGLARLGADCAFFLAARSAGAALATGRGESVAPISVTPPWQVALITPDIDCATPAVYGALGLAVSTKSELGAVRTAAVLPGGAELLAQKASAARALLRNDLEPAATAAFPELELWRGLFTDLGESHFTLAGSGSSFFGLFETADDADEAVARALAAAAHRGLGVRFAGTAAPAGDGLLARQPADSEPEPEPKPEHGPAELNP